MASKKVNIDINTTANTAGADKASKALQKTADEAEKAAQKTENASVKAEAKAAAEAERSSRRKIAAEEKAAQKAIQLAQKEAETKARLQIREEQRRLAAIAKIEQAEIAAKKAEKALDGIKKSSDEVALSAKSEATQRQKQSAETIHGFNGQIEALDKMKAAETKAANEAKKHAKESGELAKASREYNQTLEEQLELEKKLQRQADVKEATRRRDERQAAKLKSSKSGIGAVGSKADAVAMAAAGAAITTSAKIASDALLETIRRFQELQKESGAALTDYDTFLDAVASSIEFISSPIEKLKEGLKSLAGLDALENSIKQADLMKTRLNEMIEARKQLDQNAKEFALGFAIMREGQEIDSATSALERQIKVLAARRALLDTQGARQDAAAIAGGADPNAVAAQALARRTSSEIASLNEELALSAQSVETAKANAQSANNRFVDAFTSGNKEAMDQARITLAESENAYSEAVADHRATVETIKIQEQQIKEQALAESERIQQESGDAITSSMQKVARSLEETAETQGGQLSSTAKAGYDRMIQLLSDSIPDENQINEIAKAMELVKRSQEGQGNEIIKGLTDLTSVTSSLQNQLSIVTRQIQDLKLKQNTTLPAR